MAFFSMRFLLFLAAVFLVHWAIPDRCKHIWLLFCSYAFYASWNIEYTIVLLAVTIVSYGTALLLGRKHERMYLSLGIGFVLCILAGFKFWRFWLQGLQRIFGIADPLAGGAASILAPVGLSFYVLEAIGYMVDVHRNRTQPERDFLKYALFLAFFPKILSGPIERSHNLLQQIRSGTAFSYEKARHGLLLLLWGYFLKLLIADRLAMIVDAAFADHAAQTGATMLVAVILYGIELYADFAGYSSIAMGIAQTLGYSLTPNFRQPYFAPSIKEFWGRWHVSLSSWLKDYVYIPLGGNRKGGFRQCLNLLATFLASGIWHGTGWHFAVWGGIHGIYQVLWKCALPLRRRAAEKSKIKRDCFSYRLFQAIMTFALVDFAWLFFRAPSATEAFLILKNILGNIQLGETIQYRYYLLGYDERRFYLLLAEIFILFAVDMIHEKKISITAWLDRQNKAFRWMLYVMAGLALVIGAIHDYGLDASTFIYTRF